MTEQTSPRRFRVPISTLMLLVVVFALLMVVVMQQILIEHMRQSLAEHWRAF